jgi:hypothetical protein
MNFLLQETIDELINLDISVSKPLMKLNYFGRLTKNEELIQFTEQELNGYKNYDESVPEYRKAIGKLIVTMQAGYNSHVKEIPISMLEKKLADRLQYLEVREGISGVEMLAQQLKGNEDRSKEFGTELPMEMLPFIQPAVSRLYRTDARIVATSGKIVGNGMILIELPNRIRTLLLDFVMKIGEQFGYNIEIETFNNQNNNQTINNYMATTINNNGDGNVINSGDSNTINATISISKGNLAELQNELGKLGIEQADVNSLTEIVQREQPNDNKELGTESKSWIMNILEKSLNGVGKIATGVSAHLLSGLIKGYYGLE